MTDDEFEADEVEAISAASTSTSVDAGRRRVPQTPLLPAVAVPKPAPVAASVAKKSLDSYVVTVPKDVSSAVLSGFMRKSSESTFEQWVKISSILQGQMTADQIILAIRACMRFSFSPEANDEIIRRATTKNTNFATSAQGKGMTQIKTEWNAWLKARYTAVGDIAKVYTKVPDDWKSRLAWGSFMATANFTEIMTNLHRSMKTLDCPGKTYYIKGVFMGMSNSTALQVLATRWGPVLDICNAVKMALVNHGVKDVSEETKTILRTPTVVALLQNAYAFDLNFCFWTKEWRKDKKNNAANMEPYKKQIAPYITLALVAQAQVNGKSETAALMSTDTADAGMIAMKQGCSILRYNLKLWKNTVLGKTGGKKQIVTFEKGLVATN